MRRQRSQNQWWLLPSLLAFRCVNALVVQTYFDPDEYWQSLEVAHRLVFGYGYMTWEWREGIRGYAHPLIFATLYKVLALCGWDSPEAVRLAPRLVQGVVAAAGDWFLYKLTARAFSLRAARLALTCQLLNWFTFYCIVRPYSNCLETVLTTAALSYWPLATEPLSTEPRSAVNHRPNPLANQASNGEGCAKEQEYARLAEAKQLSKSVPRSNGHHRDTFLRSRASREESTRQAETDRLIGIEKQNGRESGDGVNRPLALFLAGLACVFRPTSAVLWAFLGARELLRRRGKSRFIFREVLPIGALCLGASTLLDRWMYGEWTVVPLNFVRFNFGGGADAYGTHPWHWYFTGGLPAMATTILPFAAVGVLRSRQWTLAYVILWVLGAYSLLGHKEFRFILPILPLVMAFAGQGLATLVPDLHISGPLDKENPPVAKPHLGPESDIDSRFAVSGAADRRIPSTITRRKPFGSAVSSADVTVASANVTGTFAEVTGESADVTGSSSEAATFVNFAPDGGNFQTSADVTNLELTTDKAPADVTSTRAPLCACSVQLRSPTTVPTKRSASKALRFALLFLALTQIPMVLYFSLVHQRGAVKAAEYLADEARRGRVSGVWFLTPCHATPFYSHVHAPVPMRILDCAPSTTGDVSEDARFHRTPAAFLAREFESLREKQAWKRSPDVEQRHTTWRQLIGSAAEGLDHQLPSHVILFDSVEKGVEELLTETGYVRGPRFFHSHFAVDRELQSHVVVYLLGSHNQPG